MQADTIPLTMRTDTIFILLYAKRQRYFINSRYKYFEFIQLTYRNSQSKIISFEIIVHARNHSYVSREQ